jgi:hypothetical protein
MNNTRSPTSHKFLNLTGRTVVIYKHNDGEFGRYFSFKSNGKLRLMSRPKKDLGTIIASVGEVVYSIPVTAPAECFSLDVTSQGFGHWESACNDTSGTLYSIILYTDTIRFLSNFSHPLVPDHIKVYTPGYGDSEKVTDASGQIIGTTTLNLHPIGGGRKFSAPWSAELSPDCKALPLDIFVAK